MKKKRTFAAIISLVLVLTLLVGCTPNESEQDESKNETVKVASYFFPVVFEPTKDWESWYIEQYGFGETLTKYSKSGEIIPWLAESWEISADDNCTWEIKLREDVVFSNGEPMTATKVKESIERLFFMEDPENGGMGNPHSHFTVANIEADDENFMVYLTTEIPTPDLPGALAYPWTMIVDAEASKELDTNIQGAITTGPYVVDVFEPAKSVTGVRNENYWNGTPGFDKVEVIAMEDSSMRAMALMDGSINYTLGLSPSDLEAIADAPNVTTEKYSNTRLDYSHINLKGIMGNDAIRHAILTSIDGDTVANNVLNGEVTWGFSVIPSGLDYGYDQLVNPFSYDEAKANQILDDAGLVDTDGDGIRELDGENIVVNYVTETGFMEAEAHAELIKKIGIDCQLVIQEDITPALNAGEFDIIVSNDNATPTGDPAKYLAHWYSKSNNNYANFSNAEYDEIYEKLVVEFDASVRRDYVIQLQQIIIDNALCIITGYPSNIVSYTTGLTGIEMGAYTYYWVTPELRFE